jgi:hypothetical protein
VEKGWASAASQHTEIMRQAAHKGAATLSDHASTLAKKVPLCYYAIRTLPRDAHLRLAKIAVIVFFWLSPLLLYLLKAPR